MAEEILAAALAPPQPGCCKARVYQGAGQCSMKPVRGSDSASVTRVQRSEVSTAYKAILCPWSNSANGCCASCGSSALTLASAGTRTIACETLLRSWASSRWRSYRTNNTWPHWGRSMRIMEGNCACKFGSGGRPGAAELRRLWNGKGSVPWACKAVPRFFAYCLRVDAGATAVWVDDC